MSIANSSKHFFLITNFSDSPVPIPHKNYNSRYPGTGTSHSDQYSGDHHDHHNFHHYDDYEGASGASGDLFRVSDEDLWPGEATSSTSAGYDEMDDDDENFDEM